ncbi:gp421 [Bacillus phage G]|uniref:Gp421 n=1 Tax=Bacillus phage G TaxID=2884420 RepID=G3MAG2_9CAUD|nr:gp421 [Bacillus phage G]AEO93679.1 gp421 [Bacillus phage G]
MRNILVNRKNLKVTGSNRSPLPFEIEINNIDVTNLKKEVKYIELENKFIEETLESGEVIKKKLYLLPQENKDEPVSFARKIETTEITDKPVMVNIIKKNPALDDNGVQKKSEITHFGETTKITSEPVMIDIEIKKEDGTIDIRKIQKTDDNNNPLYYGEIGTGIFNNVFILETISEQKRNNNNEPLYYKETRKDIVIKKQQKSLEITKDDPRWNEQLEEVKEKISKTKIVSFEENMEHFNLEDIVKHKEEQLINGTFYSRAILFEVMNKKIFSTNLSSYKADLGVGFISLPPNGEIRTVKLTLPLSEEIIGIKLESSDSGVEIKIGNTTNNMQLIDQNNECYFETAVSEVYVNFKNTSNKRININSFALLV